MSNLDIFVAPRWGPWPVVRFYTWSESIASQTSSAMKDARAGAEISPISSHFPNLFPGTFAFQAHDQALIGHLARELIHRVRGSSDPSFGDPSRNFYENMRPLTLERTYLLPLPMEDRSYSAGLNDD